MYGNLGENSIRLNLLCLFSLQWGNRMFCRLMAERVSCPSELTELDRDVFCTLGTSRRDKFLRVLCINDVKETRHRTNARGCADCIQTLEGSPSESRFTHLEKISMSNYSKPKRSKEGIFHASVHADVLLS